MRASIAIAEPVSVEIELALTWAGGALLVLLLWALLVAGQTNLLCALVLAIPLVLLAVFRPQAAAVCTLVYLVLLGDIRRVVAQIAAPGTFDPLLLVTPVVTVVLAAPLLFRLRLTDTLSKVVLALLVVMGLEVINPKQGPLSIGLSGVFFYIIPVLWFWVGRGLGSPELIRIILYKALLPLGLCAAAMGICQNFIGFLPYQQAWITEVSKVYTSLYVGSSVRAFGFSTSAAEYATLLELSIAAATAAYLGARRTWLAAVPILAAALLLSGGRGLTIKIVAAIPILWLIRRGQKVSIATAVSMIATVSLALLSLSFVASYLATPPGTQRGNSAVQDALSHQLSGLAHPFDDRYSSAGVHSNMVLTGFTEGLTNPLGRGLGSTTFAAQKFDADTDGGSSELDFSDMFIALGLAGGLLYLAVALFGVRAAWFYVRDTQVYIGLPVFAILIANLGGWLIQGQYSTCAIVFFLLGSVVHRGAPSRMSNAASSPYGSLS